MYDLDDRMLLVELFEIYNPLLTEKQREIFKLYYFNDFSLAEVSERLGIRRQTVHGVLKDVEKKLAVFEGQMKLAYKRSVLDEIVNRLEKMLDSLKRGDAVDSKKMREEIERLRELF